MLESSFFMKFSPWLVSGDKCPLPTYQLSDGSVKHLSCDLQTSPRDSARDSARNLTRRTTSTSILKVEPKGKPSPYVQTDHTNFYVVKIEENK